MSRKRINLEEVKHFMHEAFINIGLPILIVAFLYSMAIHLLKPKPQAIETDQWRCTCVPRGGQ